MISPEDCETIIVTIDGPAGSGKTTTARLLAKRLGFLLLESGILYRFITYALQSSGLLSKFLNQNPSQQRETLKTIFQPLAVTIDSEGTKIWFEGKQLGEELRMETVEREVSRIAALPMVREGINEFIRGLIKGKRVVAEGRDMGSVVFPSAKFKFYLTALEEIRAQRRTRDLRGLSLREVKELINKRDELDTKREIAPLRVPSGAIVIDNSELTIEEVVSLIEEKVKAGV